MQIVADMRGVWVKNRGKFADVLCGRPLSRYTYVFQELLLRGVLAEPLENIKKPVKSRD